MKKWAFLLIFAFAIPSHGRLLGEELYHDFLTGFDSISEYASASGAIVIDNQTDSTIFETLPFDIHQKNFTYQIRLQNASKTAPAGNASGFGILWNYIDSDNFYALRLNAENTAPFDDIVDRRLLSMKIYRMENGTETVYRERYLEQGIDSENGFNSVKIEKEDSVLLMKIGNKHLQTVATLPIPIWPDICHIGYFAESGCRLVVKRIHYKDTLLPEKQLMTHWTEAKLDSIFNRSTDPNEGYWLYLDRNTDERFLKLGGKYRLAIVRCGNSYQLLYLSGAKVHSPVWQTFMLKGQLSETPFVDHYDLIWYDTEKHIIEDESYATFSEKILTFHFPLKKSEIRFYKESME